jgi:hypothetical protein
MEEADLLCDDIHIMAEGRLAASGSPLSLKARYGVGYTLTVVLQQPQHKQQPQLENGGTQLRHCVGGGSSSSLCSSASTSSLAQQGVRAAQAQAAADSLMQLVQQHIPSAQLLSAAGSEVSVRLPKEEASAFPAALRALDAATAQLGVSSYGLSVTTLEEVFLSIADQAVAVDLTEANGSQLQSQQPSSPVFRQQQSSSPAAWSPVPFKQAVSKPGSSSRLQVVAGSDGVALRTAEEGLQGAEDAEVLSGAALYWQQLKALFVKRALCAR